MACSKRGWRWWSGEVGAVGRPRGRRVLSQLFQLDVLRHFLYWNHCGEPPGPDQRCSSQIRRRHLIHRWDKHYFLSKFACIFWLLLPFKNICYLSTLWQISQQILHVSWADLEFQYNLVFCLFSQGFLRG